MDRIERLAVLNKYSQNERLFRAPYQKHSELFKDYSCIFGVSFEDNSLPFLLDIPLYTKALYSYYASSSLDILNLFSKLNIIEYLEHLTLGLYNFNSIDDYNIQDYSQLTSFLESISFLTLDTFEYGVDLTDSCAAEFFPDLGNLTNVFQNMPALENLCLNGKFELNRPVEFNNLRNAEISTYWLQNHENGRVSNETLNFLLSSKFEQLENLSIDLSLRYEEYFDPIKYSIENTVFKNDGLNNLKCLSISGSFVKGTREMLQENYQGKIKELYLWDITED